MKDDSKTKKLGDWGIAVIGCGLFVTISILGYQFYYWLKSGEWLPLPLYKPLQYVGIRFERILDLEWEALQKIIFWILEQPLAGVIGAITLVSGWLMTMKK